MNVKNEKRKYDYGWFEFIFHPWHPGNIPIFIALVILGACMIIATLFDIFSKYISLSFLSR